MHIVKWFIEKAKQLAKDYQARIWYRRFCSLTEEEQRREILGDEEWRKEKQWKLECEEAERQYHKEQEEHMLQQEAELNEEKRIECLIEDREVEAYFDKKYPRCYDCGSRSPHCSCDE